MKCNPPIETLPSFLSTGIILSYFAYADEVKDLLVLLSQKTRRYLRHHERILDSFLLVETSAHLLKVIRASCKMRKPTFVKICGLESQATDQDRHLAVQKFSILDKHHESDVLYLTRREVY